MARPISAVVASLSLILAAAAAAQAPVIGSSTADPGEIVVRGYPPHCHPRTGDPQDEVDLSAAAAAPQQQQVIRVDPVTGKLGLFLAVPPGFATIIWPPSGIALGMLIMHGRRLWPGILLGSFVLNAQVAGAFSDGVILAKLPLAFGIALGSTIQALVGWFLVKRFISAKVIADHGAGQYSVTATPGLGYSYRWDEDGDGKPDSEAFGDKASVAFALEPSKARKVQLEVKNAFGQVATRTFELARPKPDRSGLTGEAGAAQPQPSPRPVQPNQLPPHHPAIPQGN